MQVSGGGEVGHKLDERPVAGRLRPEPDRVVEARARAGSPGRPHDRRGHHVGEEPQRAVALRVPVHAGPQRHARLDVGHLADLDQVEPAAVTVLKGERHPRHPGLTVLGRGHLGHGCDLQLQAARAGVAGRAERAEDQAVGHRRGHPHLRRVPSPRQLLDPAVDELAQVGASHELHVDPQRAASGLALHHRGGHRQPRPAVEPVVEPAQALGELERPPARLGALEPQPLVGSDHRVILPSAGPATAIRASSPVAYDARP